MKILYSHRTRSADGQYVHIRALNEALLRQGASVMVAGPDGIMPGSALSGRLLDSGAGRSGSKPMPLPRAMWELAEYAYAIPAHRRLEKAARQFAPDVLYERYNLFYPAGAWLKQKHRLPMILEVNAPLRAERAAHGGLALNALAAKTEHSVWAAADAVLPVTKVLATDIIAAGVPEEKITIIPNGIDDLFLGQPDPGPVRQLYGLIGKKVLGFTGFVRDWHGVDEVLEFLSAENNPSLHLLLVGDGPHVPALQEKARGLGIADQFTVTGVVQKEDLPGHIAAFDIALQPKSTAYASPLKLFEYMGLGRAIVAPAQPNIREILTDGKDAVLFQPDHPVAFRKALEILCKDEKLRHRLGAAARQTVQMRDLTWDGNARKVLAIARSLAQKP